MGDHLHREGHIHPVVTSNRGLDRPRPVTRREVAWRAGLWQQFRRLPQRTDRSRTRVDSEEGRARRVHVLQERLAVHDGHQIVRHLEDLGESCCLLLCVHHVGDVAEVRDDAGDGRVVHLVGYLHLQPTLRS